MKKIKEAGSGTAGTPAQEELDALNALNHTSLKAEDVYVFCVRLCDNEVDRDHERFPRETLEQLAPLFVGKCGIFDHNWSAKEQVGRIYRTELVEEPKLYTTAGDPYCYLKGWAYMLRTPESASLIAEIEGGIKKEVSVGCSVSRAVCSICGADIHDRESCAHVKGRVYDGKRCWAELLDATDAYEWSFVAVPAQVNAGVIKGMKMDRLEQLEREAQTGRRYLSALRKEVVRLGGMVQPELRHEVLTAIAGRLEEDELENLRKVYEIQARKLCPDGPQLWDNTTRQQERDDPFLI